MNNSEATIVEKDNTLLGQEYFHLQNSVEKYDSLLLTIKQWSVTTSIVGIGAGFLNDNSLLMLAAAFSAALFWTIDAVYKRFQNANYYRLRHIERFLNGEEYRDFRYPYITSAWGRGYRQGPSFLKVAFWPQVYLPHLPIVLVGFICWLIN